MSYFTACLCVFLLYFVMNTYQSLHVIPERAAVTYFNKLYFEDSPIYNVRRYERRGEYYANIFFTSKIVLGNTLTVDCIFYEYLHNEFRRSFPELHFKLCDLIHHDPYLGKTLRMAGVKTCPIPPGKYELRNMSFNHNVPSVWPFEKGMIELILRNPNENGLLLARGEVVVTFKQALPRFKA